MVYCEEMPNFKCIGKGIEALNKSLLGDIITDGKHMGFISGYRKTISASSKAEDLKVVENDWGWREDQKDTVKIFRYMPNSEDEKKSEEINDENTKNKKKKIKLN